MLTDMLTCAVLHVVLLLTLSPTLAFASICSGIPTSFSCTAISSCHWCSTPSGEHDFCTSINSKCPNAPPTHPKLNGFYFSTASFDVFNFTENADNTSIAITSLNNTFTPTTMTVTNGIQCSVKLSNEPVARSGFIEYLPTPTAPSKISIRIIWEEQGVDEQWQSGSLPPPTVQFPLLFNATLFHTPTLEGKGKGKYYIFSLTTDVNTGNYNIISLNNTFAPTFAVGHETSGVSELVSASFNNSNTPTTGQLRSLGKGMTNFVWRMGKKSGPGGLGQVVWQIGPTPPPRPPPPIEKCSGNFNADQCKKFDTRGLTCEWCVSNDHLDQLCFTSTNLPNNATWTCEAREV